MNDDQKLKIFNIVHESKIIKYHWPERGNAPSGYYIGMAFAFCKSYCKLKNGDSVAFEMAKAETNNPSKDAISHYQAEFSALDMSNNISGVDTLRHLFVLLLGLGMRESSGQHCEGRDMSASNEQGETAEAGLFQCSYNLQKANPILEKLFDEYSGRTDLLEYFEIDVKCSPKSWKNWGEGKGVEFQALTKICPAFAVEFAAIGLRSNRKHWGPINSRSAELRADSNTLFRQVQDFIEAEGII